VIRLYSTKVQLQEFLFLDKYKRAQRISGFDFQRRLVDGDINLCLSSAGPRGAAHKESQFSGVTFVFARRDEVNSLWKMK
jgi:hypothetical protein